ncbi:hypothetical protein ACROYT_G043570 [Oculina patagonica]
MHEAMGVDEDHVAQSRRCDNLRTLSPCFSNVVAPLDLSCPLDKGLEDRILRAGPEQKAPDRKLWPASILTSPLAVHTVPAISNNCCRCLNRPPVAPSRRNLPAEDV